MADPITGALGAVNEWAGNFFSQHNSQSAQSYSAAVARDLGLMNQYFTYQNMTYSKILQSMLNNESYGHNRSLMELQNKLQEALNATAFGYDKSLSEYQRLLNKQSADEDYKRSLSFVRDSLLKYKSALQEAGYNPLLALGSSAASYGGHTNGVTGGGVSSGGIGLGSVGSGGVSGGSPASPSGVGVSAASAQSSRFADNLHSAVEVAKAASEIKANESRAQSDSAAAALSLEKAKTENNQRTDTGHRIQSETARNYGSIASGVATGIGTAFGASKLARAAKSVMGLAKSGNVSGAAKTAVTDLLPSSGNPANSARLGSRILSLALPLFAGAALAKPVADKGMSDAVKGAKSGDSKWYDKWRRIYFPMTGGM